MLNFSSLQSIIESLAVSVGEDLKSSRFTVTKGENRQEGDDYTEVLSFDVKEYVYVAWEKDATPHDLCVHALRQVINLMPKEPVRLYWRVKPLSEHELDYASDEWRHRLYFRLCWVPMSALADHEPPSNRDVAPGENLYPSAPRATTEKTCAEICDTAFPAHGGPLTTCNDCWATICAAHVVVQHGDLNEPNTYVRCPSCHWNEHA
jgi:hypothetical protein